ncbi:ATP-dependent Lon protease pim1 [Kappamyces sp. JEL0680]|nr:ATP-dependent Lon protease pim1 [Kappamyces sp. JEL0680]
MGLGIVPIGTRTARMYSSSSGQDGNDDDNGEDSAKKPPAEKDKKDPLKPKPQSGNGKSRQKHVLGRLAGGSGKRAGLTRVDSIGGGLVGPPSEIPSEFPYLLSIPLSKRPLFPGYYKSMYIKDPKIIAAVQELVRCGDPYIGIFMAKDDTVDSDVVTSLAQVEKVGVFAQITNAFLSGPDNSMLTVIVYPHRRIRITELTLPTETQILEPPEKGRDGRLTAEGMVERLNRLSLPVTQVENLLDQPYNPENRLIKATTNEVINTLRELSQGNPLLRDQILTMSAQSGTSIQEPSKLADFAAALSSGEPRDLQGVLESLVIEERLHKALVTLKKELANTKLQQEISQEVDKKINRKNQEYFLMEQLKGIKKELGMENDGKEKMIATFKEKAAQLVMPEHAKKVFDEEIQKLSSLEPQAAEFNVTRNYLDWITQIPWGKRSQENFELATAKEVLDSDHYGLNDVKDRILEFIAVGKLRGTVEGKIITLVGPPGVGKTSVGKSIARALGREFYRFSVGGLTDVAEIKGHRRTYVGAMPGKVVQALKKVKTENPLIMIDEIDKLGRGHQGDPASALLELLDPEQNNSFLDHYMDIPLDLSKVLFVCTANSLETIPGPLLDRMEQITLSGYVAEEKVAIASKYLSPQSIDACGLKNYHVNLTPEAILALIRNYCRENGVRNLKKQIDKIYRKAAFKIVDEQRDASEENAITITPENLSDFVGPPTFTSDRMYDVTPPGVVMGLAWTQMGGSTLYIESVLESALRGDSKPSFHRTGQMGDVMKESSTIAYTFAKSFIARRFPQNQFFDKASVHMHIPEGATPKDGPSGGCTMTTSLLSLALGKSVIPDVAMTGEITLTGKILKIGGVKEKAIAAKRSGVKTIIFPAANQADWIELPDYLKEGLEPHFVSWYDEIFDIVFPAASINIGQ